MKSLPTTLVLARRLSHLRKEMGLSQKSFARQAGISPSYLAKLECATAMEGVSLEILLQVANVLHMNLAEFCTLRRENYQEAQRFLHRRERLRHLHASYDHAPKPTLAVAEKHLPFTGRK